MVTRRTGSHAVVLCILLGMSGAALGGGTPTDLSPQQAAEQLLAGLRGPVRVASDADGSAPPLKCATHLIETFERSRSVLPARTVAAIDALLAPVEGEAVHFSPSGRFRLSYGLEGEHAVTPDDTDPANGVPDLVERVAVFLDEAWRVEVDESGFTAPVTDDGVLDVSFQDMGFYGYTVVADVQSGLTRLVLHSTFEGFPPNNDPDGDRDGAAKVTAAHELRHAGQYAASRFSELGWVELDAVWFEELVYDEVDDYLHYLAWDGPVRRPDLPLDDGPGGTGSYEDVVFQLWLSETHGVSVVRDFWLRRSDEPEEDYLDSWVHVLGGYGGSLTGDWGRFTAWNHATGARALPGLGYEEGAAFPLGPVVATAAGYPFQIEGEIEHLAAAAVRLVGFENAGDAALELTFAGHEAGDPLLLSLVVQWRDGTGSIIEVEPGPDHAASWRLDGRAGDLLSVGVVVGNPLRFGTARPWRLTAALTPSPPPARIDTDRETLRASVRSGGTGTARFSLANDGEAGSQLAYRVRLWSEPPPAAASKSIVGSTLRSSPDRYRPGEPANLLLALTNGSTDNEWLTDVEVDFPAGVTVVSASDFEGGSLGPLVCDGASGHGAVVTWHGEVEGHGYGVVRGGETVVAEVRLDVAPGFTGDLVADVEIRGDGFSQAPHRVHSRLVLRPGDPLLAVTEPRQGIWHATTDSLTVSWTSAGLLGDVGIEFSGDGGRTWLPVGAAAADAGTARVQVPPLPATLCRIRLTAGDGVEALNEGTFLVYEPPSWLGCAGMTGLLAAGEADDIELAVDATDLEPGSHLAWVTVEDARGAPTHIMPLVVTVTTPDLPSAVRLVGVSPNPFNPSTRIVLDVYSPVPVAVDVLDARGALVRRAWRGEPEVGMLEVRWDGRDDRGRQLPAGVYLVRVRAGDDETAGKITLVR